jgi:hypothetical protein
VPLDHVGIVASDRLRELIQQVCFAVLLDEHLFLSPAAQGDDDHLALWPLGIEAGCLDVELQPPHRVECHSLEERTPGHREIVFDR